MVLATNLPYNNFYSLEVQNGYLLSKYDFGDGFKEFNHTLFGKVTNGQKQNFTIQTKPKAQFTYGKATEPFSLLRNQKIEASSVFLGGLPMRAFKPIEYIF